MTDSLTVDVNRNGHHTLEVPDSFETGESFSVELRNHGEATHVHLHLDDTLSTVAALDAPNHYVEGDGRRTVRIPVRDRAQWPGETVRGRLKVVTAHGRETRYVEVVLDGTPDKEPVQVDPDLSKPKQREEPSPMASSPVLRALPVAVLGSVALIFAIGTVFAGDGVDFVLGGFAVAAGAACAVAAYYLLT